jgi:hypothetical protein
MREKREENREKEAEKERTKSPPATIDRATNLSTSSGALPTRGKSMDIKREEGEKSVEESAPQ